MNLMVFTKEVLMKQTIDLGEGRTYKYSKSYEGITYTRPDGNSLTVSFRRFTDGDAHSCGDFFGISVILHKKPKFGIIKQKEELLFDYNIHFSKNDSQDVKLAKLSISELLKKEDIVITDNKAKELEEIINQTRKTIISEGFEAREVYEKERETNLQKTKLSKEQKQQADYSNVARIIKSFTSHNK